MPLAIEPKLPLKERFQAHLAEYGPIAIATYFSIFAIVFAGFAIAIPMGVEIDSAAGTAGTLGAAYLATKLTQPLRILATLMLTPLVARVVRQVRPKPSA